MEGRRPMPALPGRPAGEASGPASRGLISAATWSPMAAGGSASGMEPSELRLLKGMTSVGQGAWCSRCDDRLACPSCTYTKRSNIYPQPSAGRIRDGQTILYRQGTPQLWQNKYLRVHPRNALGGPGQQDIPQDTPKPSLTPKLSARNPVRITKSTQNASPPGI